MSKIEIEKKVIKDMAKLDKKRNEKLVLRAWDKLYTYVSLEKTYNPDRTWTAMQM